jgi:hypothetical protein
MVFFYRSPQAIVISALCSIAIAAFVYFVIVKPQTDSANDQVNHALKQAQPSIDAANRQLQGAQPSIEKANRIQDCILKANGDVTKIAACNK